MGLLDGVTVVDFTRYFPGPYATLRLSDWGASVLKVEAPQGDPARFMFTQEEGVEGAVFRSVNRGKDVLVVNLKDPEDKARVLERVREADVLVEGFRPGVMDRLGFGFEAMKELNPALVYCSVTGYGQNGPYAALSGHDLNYMALTGCLDQLHDEAGRPVKPRVAFGDLVGGLAASEAILAGLVHRASTNEGCYLDISLAEAVFSLLGLHVTNASLDGGLYGLMDESIAYAIYETSDGRYVTIAAIEPKFWRNFCEAAGCDDLIEAKEELAVAGNPSYERMCEVVRAHDFAYWCDFFKRVDCCFAPVLNIREAMANPSLTERGLVGQKWGAAYVSTHYLEGSEFLRGDEAFPPLAGHSERRHTNN